MEERVYQPDSSASGNSVGVVEEIWMLYFVAEGKEGQDRERDEGVESITYGGGGRAERRVRVGEVGGRDRLGYFLLIVEEVGSHSAPSVTSDESSIF